MMSMMTMHTSANNVSSTMPVDCHDLSCVPSAIASSTGLCNQHKQQQQQQQEHVSRSKGNPIRTETRIEYHDHANEYDGYHHSFDIYDIHDTSSMLFPMRLHKMLQSIEDNDQSSVIRWQPHGRCFIIHKPKTFLRILPQYFSHKNLASFQRQLNLYGFKRITKGSDRGAYYNEWFLRGKPFLALYMSRQPLKGTRYRPSSNRTSEPDFWLMPWVKTAPLAVARPQFNGSSDQRAMSNKSTSLTTKTKTEDFRIGSMVPTSSSSSVSSISSSSSPSPSASSASLVPSSPHRPPPQPATVKSICEVGHDGKDGTRKYDDDNEETKSNENVNETPCVIENKLFFPVDTCEEDQDGTSLMEYQEKEESDCYQFPMIDQGDGLTDLANVCAARLDNLLSNTIA